MVILFIPDIPELMPLVRAAQTIATCRVLEPCDDYWRVEAEQELQFSRRAMALGPAIWNSALSGVFRGRIVEYGRDVLRIVSED